MHERRKGQGGRRGFVRAGFAPVKARVSSWGGKRGQDEREKGTDKWLQWKLVMAWEASGEYVRR